jgi:hypothetical protein
MPSGPSNVSVRFVDGAPSLEALVNGTPQSICVGVSAPCYLQVNGQTVSQLFYYGTMTPFVSVPAGTLSLVARDVVGYAVGPIKTTTLSAGKRYTLVAVGAYPAYSVVAFEEPKSASGAQVSLYEASPSVPSADFGRFAASSRSNFTKLGSAHFGTVATVALGNRASNLGGYVGSSTAPLGALTLKQINSFDRHDVLPFHQAARLSLFLFDPVGSSSPVFGSLDR